MHDELPVLIELAYFPPVQFFSKLFRHSLVLIEQCENYNKGSYRNRCHIAGPNGLMRLSVPLVKGKNERQNIRQVRIAYEEPWQRQHWNSIQTAYGSAPYFEFYAEPLRSVLLSHFTYLFDLNWDLLQVLLSFIPIPGHLELTEKYQPVVPSGLIDLRNTLSPRRKKQENDPHFKPTPYPQVFLEKNGFIPNLSILDLLFCTGPEASIYLERSTK